VSAIGHRALPSESAAVALHVSALDRTASAIIQRDAIEEALAAALRLQDWAIRHQTQIAATI
jgi:hypothetical protein